MASCVQIISTNVDFILQGFFYFILLLIEKFFFSTHQCVQPAKCIFIDSCHIRKICVIFFLVSSDLYNGVTDIRVINFVCMYVWCMMRKIYQDIFLCYKLDTISRDYPCVPMNENGSPPKLDQNLILAYGDRQVRIFHPRI